MSHVRRFDHVGITVADLDAATQFFVALGLEIEGRTFVEGEFIDTVIGIRGSRTEIVMLRPPDNGTGVELSSFVRPSCVPCSPAAMANEVGRRAVSSSRARFGVLLVKEVDVLAHREWRAGPDHRGVAKAEGHPPTRPRGGERPASPDQPRRVRGGHRRTPRCFLIAETM